MFDTSESSWTVLQQVTLSTGFPRQEYRRGLPFPSPGELLDPGIKLGSLASRIYIFWNLWWLRGATVHRVAESQTWLKRLSMHACSGILRQLKNKIRLNYCFFFFFASLYLVKWGALIIPTDSSTCRAEEIHKEYFYPSTPQLSLQRQTNILKFQTLN